MNTLTGLAYALAGAPLAQRLFAVEPNGLTTVLYHRFFFDGEPKQRSRERLRRQLQWLRSAYNPLTLEQFHRALTAGVLPARALLVTADDAMVDLLDVHEEFRAAGVPLTVYVCTGWTAQASELEPDGLLARVVTTIEWYTGPDVALSIGKESRQIMIGRSHRSATVDQILASRGYYQPHLEELLAQVQQNADAPGPPAICTWPELVSLRESGVQFGAHSVSHIRLAPASDTRLQFEVAEAKRLIDRKLAPCSSFAYPFGIEGTCDERTTAVVQSAGLTTAFMTHPGFAPSTAPAFHLPRFALPERPMTDGEYRGRVRGGGLLLRRLKDVLHPKGTAK